MKKSITLVLAALMMLSLTACGGGSKDKGGALPGIDMKSTDTQTVTSDRATLEVLNETFFTYLGGLNYFTDSDPQAKLTYDYAGLKPFSTAYLPGFLADKYDVTVEESHDRADGRCSASLEGALRRTTTTYDSCVPLRQDIRLRRGKVHYALLPVWMLHTKWNGKDFLFAMNGQTGTLVGDLPTDMGKFWAIFAAVAAPVTAIAALIMMLF